MLLKRKAETDRKIEAVTNTIRLLEPLYGRDRDPSRLISLTEMRNTGKDVGITKAVLCALMASSSGLSPTEVRDVLSGNGYEIRGDNPMAAVHTILKRLASKPNGPVIVQESDSGKRLYKYVA